MDNALRILEQYKGEIEAELEKFLPRQGEPREFYEPVWELLDRGGKRFRPALSFLACETVGGIRENAMAGAAAVELLHNMTLVHDDIEDNSELRRGKPCLHKIYGVPTAINTGDAMLIKVFEIANSAPLPPQSRQALVSAIAKRAYEITWGQAFEFSMWKRSKFTEEEVIRILTSKTGALTRLSTETGAISGGGTQEQIDALATFGEVAGIAFQIQDDILNVSGKEKYGKEIGGDIREGKKTVMAAHLLKVASPSDRKAFTGLLGEPRIKQSGIRKAIRLYEKYGSIDYAKNQAKLYLDKARTTLARLPKSNSRDKLEELAKFLVERAY